MDSIFNMNGDDDDEYNERINIDDLYEKKQTRDMNKMATYRKILNQIHKKIKLTSRQSVDTQCCWYVFPEIIIGVPSYDQAHCVAFVMNELKENGFALQYTNPNLLFISWKHWVPTYVRNEIHKQTGVKVDGTGKIISKPSTSSHGDSSDKMSLFTGARKPKNVHRQMQNYQDDNDMNNRNTRNTTASVKSIYNMNFFNELNKKL